MKHVLLLTDRFLRHDRTGLDRYCDEIAYYLPRLAPELSFTLVSFGEPSTQCDWFASNIRHRGLKTSRRRYLLTALSGVWNPLNTLLAQADLVHALLPLPVRTRKPLLVTVHDLTTLLYPTLYPRYNRAVTRATFRQLNATGGHFCAVSDSTAHDLARLTATPSQRIERVYQGIDTRRFTPHPGRFDAVRDVYGLPERYLLYVGSMHPRKNLSTLLQAYRLYQARAASDVKLVLVGRMSLGGDHLAQEIAAQQMEGAVVLPGYVEERHLPEVMAGADALVYPSLYEGFGFPVLEAMACGVPVVTSRTSSLPEVAGDAALMVDPLDVQALADALYAVTVDDVLRQRLIAAGCEQVKRFRWQDTAVETLNLYARIYAASGA